MFTKLRNKYLRNIERPFLLKYALNGNKFVGCLPKLVNSKIQFYGSNNILFCENDVVITDSTISFFANNSLVYISSGKHRYNISIYNNSVFYAGRNNYFNPYGNIISAILSEEKNIFIGNNNLFSFEIFLRTADPHLVYDIDTHNRINLSKSIYIGDHVWISQDTTILKGSMIYSGSIIGAKSLVANKTIFSNQSWGGCPAKLIKDNVFWNKSCVHHWTSANTIKNMSYPPDDFVYRRDEDTISFDEIENKFKELKTAEEKMLYLQNISQNKNRFAKRSDD